MPWNWTCSTVHEMFGLSYTIFRPHNVYGENQNIGDRYRNVIGIFINQVMQNQPMTVFGDGLQTRAFSCIDDVAPIIAKSVEVPEAANQVFNIGADQPYSVLAVAHEVARAFGVKPLIQHLPARNEAVHAFSSHGKLTRIFGKQKFVTLEKGIGRMAAWAQGKGPRRSSLFTGVEVLKNMPPSWRLDFEKSNSGNGFENPRNYNE